MLNRITEAAVPPVQHPFHPDPQIVSLHKNLDRINSVAKLFKSLTPADFSPTEDEVWNHMGQVLASAVFNIKRIAGQLEAQVLLNSRKTA